MKRHALTTLGCIIALATISANLGAPLANAQAVERPTVTVEVHGGGFHWGDAAIGGVVMAGVVIVQPAPAAQNLRRTHGHSPPSARAGGRDIRGSWWLSPGTRPTVPPPS